MNAFFSSTFVNLFGTKIVRLLLGYLATRLNEVGVTLEIDSLYTFTASALLGIGVIVWSMVAKHKPDAADQSKLADFFHASASLMVPGLIAFMHSHGLHVTGADSMDVVMLGALQVAASGLNKPDAKAVQAKS